MEQQSPHNPPVVSAAPRLDPAPLREPAPPPPQAPPLRAQWTPARQRIFLAALLETGSVARAARAAGMSRSSAFRLRARMAGTPFDRIWDQILVEHARRMADPYVRGAEASARREPGASPARR
jgi:AraC-like DNA-binding protein